MSMIQILGEGYYGVEDATREIPASVLEQIDAAYAKAFSIPDEAIVITEYQHTPEASAQGAEANAQETKACA